MRYYHQGIWTALLNSEVYQPDYAIEIRIERVNLQEALDHLRALPP